MTFEEFWEESGQAFSDACNTESEFAKVFWNEALRNAPKNTIYNKVYVKGVLTELLPCPFCGDKVDDSEIVPQIVGENAYMIQCSNCGLSMIEFSKDSLRKAWNNRTPNT